jgi:transcriptional regulator with GAF, ATPase, and Fis domain
VESLLTIASGAALAAGPTCNRVARWIERIERDRLIGCVRRVIGGRVQEGIFEAIGDERSQRVDVRVVAATNRDLREEVAAKRFRQDLFFRLSVFPIPLPPLRQRLEDIPLLAQHFLKQASRRFGKTTPILKQRHVSELQAYPWPGNVRELQHVIERAVIGARDGILHLPLESIDAPASKASSNAPSPPTNDDVLTYAELEQLERRNLEAALRRTSGKVSGAGGAAALMGINPSTLASKLKRFGI